MQRVVRAQTVVRAKRVVWAQSVVRAKRVVRAKSVGGYGGPFRGPPLENADDAVELRFRIDQIHALGGDPQPLGGAAQAVLDDRAP